MLQCHTDCIRAQLQALVVEDLSILIAILYACVMSLLILWFLSSRIDIVSSTLYIRVTLSVAIHSKLETVTPTATYMLSGVNVRCRDSTERDDSEVEKEDKLPHNDSELQRITMHYVI
jgi:hypothetical protein